MPKQIRRIAINIGGGYVPGSNSLIAGTVMAASQLGWEVVGIRDGYDGLLFPERYSNAGLVPLHYESAPQIASASGSLLGMAARSDPFHVRTLNADDILVELDRSEELLQTIASHGIDAVVSVVGPEPLSILWKLSRKGLKTVAVPKSVENEMAMTSSSFGFDSAMSFATVTMDRVRQAAEASRAIGIVEVPGECSGWLALQSGIAAGADVILIPEIPFDLKIVAATLRKKLATERSHALVVVAEGAKLATDQTATVHMQTQDSLKSSLSPAASEGHGGYVIERSGRMAEQLTLEIQRLTNHEIYPLVLGQLVRGGQPTAVDRQLGLAYGAAAVRALQEDFSGVMVSFQPPDLKFVPLSEAINKVRVVPVDSVFIQVARALGISLGDGGN